MNKWIRWWGIAAFIIIILLSIFTWYIFADKIIESKIEESGEYIFGATVDVGKADLKITPFGLDVFDVQIANPNAPMKNLFDAEKIYLKIDDKHIFDRKVIIKDMVIEGLKFNTDRESAAQITNPDSWYQQAYEDFALPIIDLTDLKALLQKEEIKSFNGFNAVVDNIKKVEGEWKYIYNTLPTLEDIRNYNERAQLIVNDINKNKIQGLITHAIAIKNLKNDINSEIANLNLNKKAMLIDLDSLTTKKNRAIIQFQNDISNLKDKYSFDFQGFKNFSNYFFKEDLVNKISENLNWYDRLHPYLQYVVKDLKNDQKGTESIFYDGINVQFPEFDPKPTFLIEKGIFYIEHEIGDIVGSFENITNQQNITGLPISVELNGTDLEFAKSVDISAIINRIDKNYNFDKISLEINDQVIKSKHYTIFNDWNIDISDGLVDRKLDLSITNDKIDGKIRFDYRGTTLTGNYTGQSNKIIDTINSVLKQINNFYLNVDINGTIKDINIDLKSDLDIRINESIRRLVNTETEKVRNYIEQEFNSQKLVLLEKINKELDPLKQEMSKVEEKLDQIKEILKILP